MSVEQALSLISKILSLYKGTLEEHTMLQQSLSIITEACDKSKSE